MHLTGHSRRAQKVDGALLTTDGIDDDWDYNVYFAGRHVWREKTGFNWSMPAMAVSPDRLGSTVRHFPYGDEPTMTAPNREKFATYYRDEVSALDYARNRYYSSTIARFTTADPYLASGGPADPQSWNRYAYVQGDPVSFNDPQGKDFEYVGWDWCPVGAGEGTTWARCEYDRWTRDFMEQRLQSDEEQAWATQEALEVAARNNDPVGYGARGILGARLANFASSNCAKVFGKVIDGYSTSAFVSRIETTGFYAARDAVQGSWTQHQVVGNGDPTTLNDSVPYGTDAVTIWGPRVSAVLLGPNYFSESVEVKQSILLHEMLHAYTHWGDNEIFAAFRDYGLGRVNPGTGDISAWLDRDCK